MSNVKYIFVHGLSGWGSYDEKYQEKPYWGMKSGDLLAFLKEKGFDSYAASVAPHGSAWDRACELYAQLSGTRVDYGKQHSEAYRHDRFGRDECDYAGYDMHVDNAAEMNRHLTTFSDIYYFSFPCSSTKDSGNGIHRPDRKITDPFFVRRSIQIGCYSGTTKGGTVIDDSWHENDGLVNTISAKAPFGELQQKLNRKNIRPGVWNIAPVYHGDHMMIHGGLTKKTDVRGLYLKMLTMIDALTQI